MSGYHGGQGVGLVEVYELDANQARLVNISTRGRVGLSDDAMIGGLIVQGSNAKRAIVRALGPSLATGPNPITGALADPVLELHDSSGALMASNDNWIDSPQYAEIVASTGAASEHNGISHHRDVRTGKLHRDCARREQHIWRWVGGSLRPRSVISMSESSRQSLMKLLRPLFLMLAVGFAVANVRATTVIPPTFDQLVGDAELIFEGTVTASRSQWVGSGAERHIVTDVTFSIEEAIKGAPGKELHNPDAGRNRGWRNDRGK